METLKEVFIILEVNISYDSHEANIDSVWTSKEKAEERYQALLRLPRVEMLYRYEIEAFKLDEVEE